MSLPIETVIDMASTDEGLPSATRIDVRSLDGETELLVRCLVPAPPRGRIRSPLSAAERAAATFARARFRYRLRLAAVAAACNFEGFTSIAYPEEGERDFGKLTRWAESVIGYMEGIPSRIIDRAYREARGDTASPRTLAACREALRRPDVRCWIAPEHTPDGVVWTRTGHWLLVLSIEEYLGYFVSIREWPWPAEVIAREPDGSTVYVRVGQDKLAA